MTYRIACNVAGTMLFLVNMQHEGAMPGPAEEKEKWRLNAVATMKTLQEWQNSNKLKAWLNIFVNKTLLLRIPPLSLDIRHSLVCSLTMLF